MQSITQEADMNIIQSAVTGTSTEIKQAVSS